MRRTEDQHDWKYSGLRLCGVSAVTFGAPDCLPPLPIACVALALPPLFMSRRRAFTRVATPPGGYIWNRMHPLPLSGVFSSLEDVLLIKQRSYYDSLERRLPLQGLPTEPKSHYKLSLYVPKMPGSQA